MGFTEFEVNKMREAVEKGKTPKKDRESYADKALASAPVEKLAKLASPKTWSKKTRGKGSKEKGEMELVIKGMFPEYTKEFQFDKTRRYRADFFIPLINTCIEYEGIMVEDGERSGHTTKTGFTKDSSKYNLMQVLGYKVLRYTAMNYKDMGADLWTLKYGVNGE